MIPTETESVQQGLLAARIEQRQHEYRHRVYLDRQLAIAFRKSQDVTILRSTRLRIPSRNEAPRHFLKKCLPVRASIVGIEAVLICVGRHRQNSLGREVKGCPSRRNGYFG
jgi:hypothetical protein